MPESWKTKFASFPLIFGNTLVSKNDIEDLMKNYAEEEKLFVSTLEKIDIEHHISK